MARVDPACSNLVDEQTNLSGAEVGGEPVGSVAAAAG